MYVFMFVCVCVREKEIESAREKEIESAREKERKSDCERAGQGRERQFVFQSKSTRCASQSTQVSEYICMYEYACLCRCICAYVYQSKSARSALAGNAKPSLRRHVSRTASRMPSFACEGVSSYV